MKMTLYILGEEKRGEHLWYGIYWYECEKSDILVYIEDEDWNWYMAKVYQFGHDEDRDEIAAAIQAASAALHIEVQRFSIEEQDKHCYFNLRSHEIAAQYGFYV